MSFLHNQLWAPLPRPGAIDLVGLLRQATATPIDISPEIHPGRFSTGCGKLSVFPIDLYGICEDTTLKWWSLLQYILVIDVS